MMHIRHMRMRMRHRLMPMPVAVRPDRHGFMNMIVVAIVVTMGVFMFQRFMLVWMVM